jgi:hypothetical protein
MKRNLRALATAGALCSLLLVGASSADAQDKPKTDAAHDAMTAEMMKYANPVAQHALLKPMVGTWNATVKQWTGGPEPTVTKGTMKNELKWGGRYLESTYKGTFDGKPFEGYGLTGYDTRRNQLISFWMDDMSTSWMTTTGTISTDGKEMATTGTMDGMDGKPMNVRTVTKIETPQKHVYTMYGTMNGQEVPFMEITYDLATGKK